MNNTEINTRLGWYSNKIKKSTNEISNSTNGVHLEDGGWNETTPFPLIQGTDCCGIVVSSYDSEFTNLINKRVIVRPCRRTEGNSSFETFWMASDFDGAFAEYVKIEGTEVFPIECNWSNVELASIPCAYGTSENMLIRANVTEKDHVLITGASGGVGSALVQLAKRRGCKVTAICGANKIRSG